VRARVGPLVPPEGSIYEARAIAEHDGTRLTVWLAPNGAHGKGTIVFFYGNAGTVSDFAGSAAIFTGPATASCSRRIAAMARTPAIRARRA
jgi:hypothetical protein